MHFQLTVLLCALAAASVAAPRPMTFLDVVTMSSAGQPVVSPDGKLAVYAITGRDWQTAKSSTDLYLVSTERGLDSIHRMTFTRGKDENNPAWSRDGAFFAFTSNREAPASAESQKQIYLMRPGGGEARRITDAKDGVAAFAFSPDGKWLAFSAGKESARQIWTLPVAEIETAKPRQLSRHAAPVKSWKFARDGKRIYFIAPEDAGKANRERIEKKFSVKIRNEEKPLDQLWALNPESGEETRLTSSPDYSVSDITLSQDARWVAFRGTPRNRYLRTVTEADTYADLYLLQVGTGEIERLTNNKEVPESTVSFSPDSSTIAFTAPDDFSYFRNRRIYVRPVQGGQLTELGGSYDENMSIDFWSANGATIYFNGGQRAAQQLFAVSLDTGNVRSLTSFDGVVDVEQDEVSKRLLVRYTDSSTPSDYYTVDSVDDVAVRAKWRQLSRANPQVSDLALGSVETVQWKASDGKTVEGVLVKPVGYEAGKRYPLIVQIHGGPAGVSSLGFNATYSNYSHIYAAAGYACLLPNYRGSTNYGERHRVEIAGDYFRQGYDDIITGVDYLIKQGLADPDRMGVMGWSAGGHWSNWILTHTDRFKAISSGAGAVNWISMYAQSDVQRVREQYYGGKPYDRFEHYWDVSPLKYIKNAKTPTLIHVVEGDPRVPRPQSEELHMALRQLGVPTEFLVYPGDTHGISDMRNQMVKMVAEFNWFEKYLRGGGKWLDWNELLATLKDEAADTKPSDNDR